MSKVSVYDQGWIDLVFEGRNKKYGAYQLRQQQSRTTLFALLSGIGLLLALVGVPAAVNYFAPVSATAENIIDKPIEPTEMIIPVEDNKPIPAEPEQPKVDNATPPAAAPPRAEPTIQYIPMRPSATPDPVDPPTVDQLANATISNNTSDGDGSDNFSTGGPVGNGEPVSTGTATGTESGDGVMPSVRLEVQPQFPGGLDKFYKKVSDEFEAPQTAEHITLRVYVSFVVEKDGSMSNITVLRDPGYGAGKEAIRVLKSIKTKWSPGKINNKAVRTAYNLPITINVK